MILNCESVTVKLAKVDFHLNMCKSAFNCNWNDVVHDSFKKLINDISKAQMEIDGKVATLRIACGEVALIKDSGS